MVFLAISKKGLLEALQLSGSSRGAIWCGSNAISEEEYLTHADANLSRFEYDIDGSDSDALADALRTIEEHHPRERMWVETRYET
jgi:hypothetical protein